MTHTQYDHTIHPGGASQLSLRLDGVETALLGADTLNLGADFHAALRAIAEIRAGRWDSLEEDPELDEGDPGARQRARMEETAHGLRDLLERLEALQAVTVRSWRARGASYGSLAKALGVSRSTAADRVKALTATPLPRERWVRGGAISPPPAVCDHTSVGVVIRDDHGRYLLIERARHPHAWAPVAGHIDDHGDPETAARQEVAEETGLTVERLLHLTGGWRPNRCRRLVRRQPGHHWTVYSAVVTGDLSPSAEETRGARWVTPDELQALTDRATAYARGEVTEEDWSAAPGLEAVWAYWLAQRSLITVTPEDLQHLEVLAASPPAPTHT
ncbi:NUDIX domain-containing protein [Streptosporangium saharense]|uniref:NUDIX domain-containing protein n=1 Tax=Streptosporangium saharense TaxID=1706840 RepID=UPI0033256212